MNEYLFVYGTLRRDSRSEMHQPLARQGVFIGDGSYQGRLFVVDYYPGAVPSDQATDAVHGEVYELLDARTVLARLDDYEECGPGYPEPHEYIRRKQYISLNGGETLEAWIYLYNLSTGGLRRIHSGDFYEGKAATVTVRR